MNTDRLRFGFVGWETTHTQAWVEIVQQSGSSAALFDDGSMRTAEETKAYCVAQDVRRCESLAELAETTDLIAIMSCDWDRHIAQAAPLVAAGKTVYIDKPVACRDADLDQLCSWQGAKVVVGSCNRYEDRLMAGRGENGLQRLDVSTSQRGEFYYPIHAVEVGQMLLGTGARRVRWHESDHPGFEVEHERCALWTVRWERETPGFVVTLKAAEPQTWTFPAGGELQKKLVAEVLRVHREQSPLVPVSEAAEAVRILRAAYASRARQGVWVSCSEPGLPIFSGAEFALSYRRALTRWSPSVASR